MWSLHPTALASHSQGASLIPIDAFKANSQTERGPYPMSRSPDTPTTSRGRRAHWFHGLNTVTSENGRRLHRAPFLKVLHNIPSRRGFSGGSPPCRGPGKRRENLSRRQRYLRTKRIRFRKNAFDRPNNFQKSRPTSLLLEAGDAAAPSLFFF